MASVTLTAFNTSGSGVVFKQGDSNWNSVWGSVTGTTVDIDTLVTLRTDLDSGSFRNANFKIPFDLSSIPQGSTIQSASLSLKLSGSSGNPDGISLVVHTGSSIDLADPTNLVVGDYDSRLNESSNRVSITSSNLTFTINSTGLAYLRSRFGSATKATLCVISSSYADNVPPTSSGNYYEANSNTTALTINYQSETDIVGFFLA